MGEGKHDRALEKLREAMEDSHPISWFKPGREVEVHDKMQRKYSYTLEARYGKDFDEGFEPELSPHDILTMGAFEGKYLCDCTGEFPREWYRDSLRKGKLSPGGPDPEVNEFRVKSRQSLKEWRRNGWIIGHDPRGWFQWYCRYYIGRRDPKVDHHQIGRWRAFRRHAGQILADPNGKNLSRSEKRGHRAKQRQALLQWAYYPYI